MTPHAQVLIGCAAFDGRLRPPTETRGRALVVGVYYQSQRAPRQHSAGRNEAPPQGTPGLLVLNGTVGSRVACWAL